MSEQKLAWLGKTASDQAEDEAITTYERPSPLEMELRREAAELLEKHGWTQGNWHRRTGEMCLEGAIDHACRCIPPELMDATKWRLERELGNVDLAQWNDTPGRTVEEVLAALRGTTS